jgi:hypothetical protein
MQGWIEQHGMTTGLALAVLGSWLRMEIKLSVIATDVAWLKRFLRLNHAATAGADDEENNA